MYNTTITCGQALIKPQDDVYWAVIIDRITCG